MCIAVFLWQAHPLYPFILLLNRDEYHNRPTEPLAWWEGSGQSQILGGRDGLAGGTWLACTRDGRVAFLTNVREAESIPQAKSRGHLPVRFLESSRIQSYGKGSTSKKKKVTEVEELSSSDSEFEETPEEEQVDETPEGDEEEEDYSISIGERFGFVAEAEVLKKSSGRGKCRLTAAVDLSGRLVSKKVFLKDVAPDATTSEGPKKVVSASTPGIAAGASEKKIVAFLGCQIDEELHPFLECIKKSYLDTFAGLKLVGRPMGVLVLEQLGSYFKRSAV